MQNIEIKNFKSYQSLEFEGLHPHINVFIGANGQGKSNLFKGLYFLFFDKITNNNTQFRSNIHRGLNQEAQDNISVQIKMIQQFKNQNNRKTNQIVLKKVWKDDGTQERYINKKKINTKQFNTFISSMHLSVVNPYNIIQQGKIIQIIYMDQAQLYKLMIEVAGIRNFNKKKQQAQLYLKKAKVQKQQIKISLSQIQNKLKSLQHKKQQYEYYAVQQKNKKYRQKKSYEQLLQTVNHKCKQIKQQYKQFIKGIDLGQNRRKLLQQQQTQIQINIKILQEKKKYFYVNGLNINKQQQHNKQNNKQQQINSKRIKVIQKQMNGQMKKLNKKDKEIDNFKQQFKILQKRYQSIKLDSQVAKNSSDKVSKALNEQINNEKQNINKMNMQQKKIIQQIKNVKKKLNNQKIINNYQQQLNKINQIKSILHKNKTQISILNFQKNTLLLQIQSIKQVLQHQQIKVRKSLPLIDVNIFNIIQHHQIQGVYGYLIDFLSINPQLTYAYQITGLTRLSSILVQDQVACKKVIQINKKNKGRQLNILQLNYYRSRPIAKKMKFKQKQVYSLFNQQWIKINIPNHIKVPQTFKSDVNKILSNSFNNYVLVKDYDQALKISKQYGINCITSQRQMVYSQGYLCKLGKQQMIYQTRLQVYKKYKDKRQKLIQKQRKYGQIEQRLIRNENEQINLMNDLDKLQMKQKYLRDEVQLVKMNKKMLQCFNKDIQKMRNNIIKSQLNIKQKQQYLKNIKHNKKQKISQNDKIRIQNQYKQKRKILFQLQKQYLLIQQNIQKLSNQSKIIKNYHNNNNNNNNNNLQYKNIVDNIQKQTQQKKQKLKTLKKQMIELEQQYKRLNSNKYKSQVKILGYEQQQMDIKQRLLLLGDIGNQVNEDMQISNSMSLSLSMSIGKRQKHFSAKDKLIFSKFNSIFDNNKQFRTKLIEIEQCEQKMYQIMNRYESEVKDQTQRYEKKFVQDFKQIFSKIVQNGQCQVKFKNVSQKVKNQIYIRRCLYILINFDKGTQLRRWSSYSGGQKTLIAIVIIMTLQRCFTAPFYVLDQIDAALDHRYVRKIASLILDQSSQNKSQYLITSFKEDMLSFSQDFCNYYKISSIDRKSRLEKIDQLDAKRYLTDLNIAGNN